ncbi:MAG: alpha/beta fold hydrolase [Acidobacteriota bacterium]
MRPVVIPLLERLGRRELRRRGVASRRVRTPHAELHAYDAAGTGSSPPIVLLHGIAASATSFGPVLGMLRESSERVLAIDYPGHGFSRDAEAKLSFDVLFGEVAHALDVLLDRPALLVGNSLGGAVALTYALRRPERVRGLVLVSPAGARASDDEWAQIRASFDLRTRAEARAFIARLYHRAPRLAPLIAGELPRLMQRRAIRELLETASNDHVPTPEQLASLRPPILLVWGKSEKILPGTLLDYFTRHLPRHTVVEQPEDFAHCPHFEAPREVARRIAEFAQAI